MSLSKEQLEKLSRAYNNNSAITIRLANNELSGLYELMLTKTQINKLKTAMSQGAGSDIIISKTQIGKAVQQGGSLWSCKSYVCCTICHPSCKIDWYH